MLEEVTKGKKRKSASEANLGKLTAIGKHQLKGTPSLGSSPLAFLPSQ